MIFCGCLLLFAGLIDTKPLPVFANVFVGAQGPYRFLIDTGAQTSLIDPKLADKLGLQPEFRVELLTQHTTELVPGLKIRSLRLSQRTLPEMEILVHDVSEARRMHASIDGVLGMNALGRFDFSLSPATGILDEKAERPAGEAIPFHRLEGRMAVKARMGRETLTLILDSGSNHVVLFRVPGAMMKIEPVPFTIATIEGSRSVVPTRWTADMFLSEKLRIGRCRQPLSRQMERRQKDCCRHPPSRRSTLTTRARNWFWFADSRALAFAARCNDRRKMRQRPSSSERRMAQGRW